MGDLYATLGVSRNATYDDLKRAYRDQARRYHPDAAAGADAAGRFQEARAAYEVLSDPEARRTYDATLDAKPGMSLSRLGCLGLVERPRPAGPPRGGDDGWRWKLTRAVEAYLFEPKPGPAFVDIVAL
jgi:curved DNA-binding protein CbpA